MIVFRIIFILLVSLVSVLEAGNWVKYGWQLYDNAGDARMVALGNAQGVNGEQSVSLLVNPAMRNIRNLNHIVYAHQSRFAGMVQNDLLGFTLQKNFTYPLHVILLQQHIAGIPNTRDGLLDWGADGIPGTLDAGEGNGILDEGERLDPDRIKSFHQQQWGLYLATNTTSQGWQLGVGIKTIFHSLDNHYASGIGLNVGLTRSLGRIFSFGATLQDASTSWLIWENGTVERMLPTLILGLGMDHRLPMVAWPVKGYVDILLDGNGEALANTWSRVNTRAGLELQPKASLRVRVGFSELGQLTGGLGIQKVQWTFDYAYRPAPASTILGPTHMLTFGLNLEWIMRFIGLSA
ncbi:MAG: hypothetical protein ACE5D8_10045 [Fidelibacterota bacterium]